MPTDPEMRKALNESSAMQRQRREDTAARARRAALDVLDGGIDYCEEAARNRGVHVELVRAAVRAERARRAGGGA